VRATPSLGVQISDMVPVSQVCIQDAVAVKNQECLKDWVSMASVGCSPFGFMLCLMPVGIVMVGSHMKMCAV